MRNRRLATWGFWGAVAGLALLATHESQRPQVLGRYSAAYFAVLLAGALALTGAVVLYRGRHRLKLRQRLVAAGGSSLQTVAEAHGSRLTAGAFLLHLVLVCIYLPPAQVFSSEPILARDYAHHFHQVTTAVEAFSTAGRHWAWDPTFCAGYPAGTLFDADMKLVELAVFVLTRAGAGVAPAYNVVILAFFLAVPALLLGSSKGFGLGPAATLTTLYAGVLLWHSAAMILTFNSFGMFTFVFATYWALWTASLLDRLLRRPRIFAWLGFLAALAAGLAIHILMPLLLAGPLGALYWIRARRAAPSQHALAALALIVALAANAWWILTVARFYPLRMVTSYWPAPRLSDLLASILGFEKPVTVLAILGIWGFLAIRHGHRALSVMGIVAICWFFFLAGLSGGIPGLNTLEIGRFAIPLAVFSTSGFAAGVASRWSRVSFADWLSRSSFPMLVILLFFAGRILAPRSMLEPGFGGAAEKFSELAGWIRDHTATGARIAFLDASPGPVSGAAFSHYADRQLIGGPFSQMNLVHAYASFTRDRFVDTPLARLTRENLARLAERYNVGWVVTTTGESCAVFTALEAPFVAQIIGGAGSDETRFCVFELALEASFFLEGSGEAEASLNRIEVRGASPGRVILKYHWLDTLAVSPALPIREHRLEGMPAGFIEVENGAVQDFVIYNAYR